MDWEREEIFIEDDMREVLKDIQRAYLEDIEGSVYFSLNQLVRLAIGDLYHKVDLERNGKK
jgi:hypothetical protein